MNFLKQKELLLLCTLLVKRNAKSKMELKSIGIIHSQEIQGLTGEEVLAYWLFIGKRREEEYKIAQ